MACIADLLFVPLNNGDVQNISFFLYGNADAVAQTSALGF